MTDDTPDDPPRKERVLHTRVPEVLEQELKRLAESLRVPVSNVVRTILEDAVDAMDAAGSAAEGQIRGVADRLREQRARLRHAAVEPVAPSPAPPPGPPLAGIVGFQPLLLARDGACSVCGTPLAAGSQAWLGVRDLPSTHRVVVGPECLPAGVSPQRGEGVEPPPQEREP